MISPINIRSDSIFGDPIELNLVIVGIGLILCLFLARVPAVSVSEGVKMMVRWCNLILIRGPQPKYLSCKLSMVVPHSAGREVHNSFLSNSPEEGRLSRLILMYLHLETKTSFL